MPATTLLFRPVGPEELALVEASGWTRFPPRLPEQPIFYPVCNVAYAEEIASRWNAQGGRSGFVTAFEVATDYLAAYTPQVVGARHHEEYWIPAEDLDAFNAALRGPIRLIRTFPSEPSAS